MSDTPPLLGRIDTLTASVDTLAATTAALASSDRRRRTQMVVLAVSVAFDLLLSAGFFFALDRTNDAQDRTDRLVEQVAEANSATLAACLASNESATKQHQLWEGLIALPSATPTTPERLAVFRALLSDTFPQRDCDGS